MKKLLTTFVKLFLISAVLFSPLLGAISAKTLSEIETSINSKKGELESVNSDMKKLEAELEAQRKELQNTTAKRTSMRGQIELHKKEIELVQIKLEDLKKQSELQRLEQEHRKIVQDTFVLDSYLDWKQKSVVKQLVNNESENIWKVTIYQSTVAGNEQQNIDNLTNEIKSLEEQIQQSELQQIEFNKKVEALNSEIAKLEEQIKELDSKVNANTSGVASYRARAGAIQSQIDQLSAEQKAIQDYEASLLKQNPAKNGATKPLMTGQYYFSGIGRDVYQGHGVGMSQFGALGAALKGWDYKKIVEFYYPGAKVVKYSEVQIKVDGHGTMSGEDYAAGAGEVPDYSCEELDMEFDNNNIWKCWPEEAIKAQIVAFRSYGIAKTKNGSSICTTAACQVYKGGRNKEWAAEATEREVLVYEGQPITAFYSSDNHNGWGTANNDTVWSGRDGTGGDPKPYLRAVNDKAITYPYVYTNWTWRTNSYTIETIDSMLTWSSSANKASNSHKDFLKEIKTEIGNLRAIEFERDPSGRIKRILLSGDKGSSYIAGWLFKSIWNIWVDNEQPSGEVDYIYSLTFYMQKA